MQMQAKTNTTVNPIDNHTIPTPKWMQFAAVPITVRQKLDKNNPLHDKMNSNAGKDQHYCQPYWPPYCFCTQMDTICSCAHNVGQKSDKNNPLHDNVCSCDDV